MTNFLLDYGEYYILVVLLLVVLVVVVAFSAIAFWIIVELGTTKLGNNSDHTTNIVTTAILGKIILWLFINT